MRSIPVKVILTAALLGLSGLASAADDQTQAVHKVLDEAIHRDTSYSSPFMDRARTKVPGERWQNVPAGAGFFSTPGDVAERRIDEKDSKVSHVVSSRGATYSTTSWKNSTQIQRQAFTRPVRADEAEVVANLPVGTEIDVQLGREKLDGVKFALMVQGMKAASDRREAVQVPQLAAANPVLPVLKVTRQDPTVPAGQAVLSHRSTSEATPNQYFNRYRRTTQRMFGRVAIRTR